MTVKGGGPRGPKFPARGVRDQDRTSQTTPETAPQTEAQEAQEAQRIRQRDADGFEDEVSAPLNQTLASSGGERAEDVYLKASDRPSSLRSSQRLLESTRQRLAHELGQLGDEVDALVQQLGEAGFKRDTVERLAPALRERRARMTKLRGRLTTIHRRLRMLALAPGVAGDAQLKGPLGARVDETLALAPGTTRTLGALHLATTMRPRQADGTPVQALRFSAPDGDREQQATALATDVASGATASLMTRLFADEQTRTDPPSQSPADEWSRLSDALRG